MERLISLKEKLGLAQLRLVGIERKITKGKEERVESVADFIEKSDPQKSIKVVCDGEEVPEIVEGIARGFKRLEEKKAKKE